MTIYEANEAVGEAVWILSGSNHMSIYRQKGISERGALIIVELPAVGIMSDRAIQNPHLDHAFQSDVWGSFC